jgi:uncharacterized protein DUF1569
MKTLLHTGEREEILRRMAKLRPDLQRHWGIMTVGEMVCHLNDSFRFFFGEKDVRPIHNLLTRTALKWAALWLPLQWRQGFPTRPEIDQRKGGTAPKEFAADVSDLRTSFDRFCAAEDNPRMRPVFGRMSQADSMPWAYLHMDHHFRQFGV